MNVEEAKQLIEQENKKAEFACIEKVKAATEEHGCALKVFVNINGAFYPIEQVIALPVEINVVKVK